MVMADVLKFSNCDHLLIQGFTAGHSVNATCGGRVVHLLDCYGTHINVCGFFGCGTIGLSAHGCTDLLVDDTDIYDCSAAGVVLNQTENAMFRKLEIWDCPEEFVINTDCKDILWDGVELEPAGAPQ